MLTASTSIAHRGWWLGAMVTTAVTAAVVAVWLLLRFDPNAAGNPFPPCLFHALTGLYCPGCGLTRALHALVHGDIARMLAMNALAPVLMLGLPALALHGLGYRLPLPSWAIAALTDAKLWLGMLFGFWLLRNLPWWPFALLAPG